MDIQDFTRLVARARANRIKRELHQQSAAQVLKHQDGDSSISVPDHQTGLPGLGGTRDFQDRPLPRARPLPEPSDTEQAWSGRFAMIPEELVCSGNSLALAVYAALDRLSPNAHLYASLTRLCQITRLSEPTVRRAIQWLEAHKFLMVESLGTGRQPTGYLLPWKDRRAQGETSDTPGVNEIDPRGKRQTPQGETRLTPGVNDVSSYVSALRERREIYGPPSKPGAAALP